MKGNPVVIVVMLFAGLMHLLANDHVSSSIWIVGAILYGKE